MARNARGAGVSPRLWDLTYVALTVVLTAYGQVVLKWRMRRFGSLPEGLADKLVFLAGMLFDPLIFSVLVTSAIAWLAWMAALVRMDLGEAYTLLSLSYVIVLLLSGWLLSEPLTAHRLIGVTLIVVGTFVATRD